MKISDILIYTDKYCSVIPVISTVTNLIDMVQKCALKIFKALGGEIENEYFRYLDDKPFELCALFAVPFYGITLLVLDKINNKEIHYFKKTL